jgi:hypothetical protein
MSTPEKKWRYPTQEQNYRDNPALQDYEDMLGHSALNLETEEFLRRTEEAVLSPEERAVEEARWEKLSMAEKMKGPPPAYLSTPGLRKEEESGIGNRGRGGGGRSDRNWNGLVERPVRMLRGGILLPSPLWGEGPGVRG